MEFEQEGATTTLSGPGQTWKIFFPYDGAAATFERINGRKAESLDEVKAWIMQKRIFLVSAASRHFGSARTSMEYLVEGYDMKVLPRDCLEHVIAQAEYSAFLTIPVGGGAEEALRAIDEPRLLH